MTIKILKKWENIEFDSIIDVRSPLEFELDNIPSSINLPVLTNNQRVLIGKIYKKENPFKAKKLGAALVSLNISKHIEESLLDKPGNWKALIYCWRGGQRSKAMATVLSEIGWQITILKGGYKTYRKYVIKNLNKRISTFSFIVLRGKTGTAKTNILEKLEKKNNLQVLNLEKLAKHKGSLIGNLPNVPQPSQKYFESLLNFNLKKMNYKKKVYIEGESSKIGNIFIPKELIKKINRSPCIEITASLSQRINFLCKDYKNYLKEPNAFLQLFDHAQNKLGKSIIDEWKKYYKNKDWKMLANKLIKEYYDLLYEHNHKKQINKIIKKIDVKTINNKNIDIICEDLEKKFRN